jgi:heavy metal translocating P-type ATPase
VRIGFASASCFTGQSFHVPSDTFAPMTSRERREGSRTGSLRALAGSLDYDGWLAAATTLATLTGVGLSLGGSADAADLIWGTVTAIVLVPLTIGVARSLWNRDPGVDAIALLAMAAALVMGEYLAGAVVGVMLSGGNALEGYAAGRAERELHSLLSNAPRIAHRYTDGRLEQVDAEQILPGDRLMVRSGEVVPVDCTLSSGATNVDESAITGESMPESITTGALVRSGSVNVGPSVDVLAQRAAADSTYAGIVRLVRSAQEEKAPVVRLADSFAVVFLPVTLITAGLAWVLSGDEVRALAVLVVATPCPLILATPIAIISGVSRAARRGIIVKGGGAIEAMGSAETVLLDKTGTITTGKPTISRVIALDGTDGENLLLLGASLDQASPHVLAEALVAAARQRGAELVIPTGSEETPGEGIVGLVEGHRVALGRLVWLNDGLGIPRSPELERSLADGRPGAAVISIAVDGELAGAVEMADPVREDAAEMIARLRQVGVKRLVLVTGDDRDVAEQIAESTGLDQLFADCSPEDKLEVVREEQARADGTVAMVGDGVNDAPALALADVGIAMGARGATAASESADAVLTVDRVDRVADAISIGRRALSVARQGVIAGMGLSMVAMGFAAFGYLTPVAGALLQEAIDVAVILNALRVLRP